MVSYITYVIFTRFFSTGKFCNFRWHIWPTSCELFPVLTFNIKNYVGNCPSFILFKYIYLDYIEIHSIVNYSKPIYIYPDWQHKQGGWIACCSCTFDSRWGCTDLYYARGAQGVTAHEGGGATSQLDLPSQTPLSVAGYGRLQRVVPHWATSVITASMW